MSLDSEYFRKVYEVQEDPFSLGIKWYEQRKYAMTVAALPKPRYRRALEPGCSIGVLTEKLAARCDRLVSTDVVQSALDSARNRVAAESGSTTVDFVLWSLTDSWAALPDPEDSFDLIVISEVGYYLDEPALNSALEHATAQLEPGGILVAVHWRHHVEDYPLSGDRVHEIIGATTGLAKLGGYRDEDMNIDVFVRSEEPAVSVAATDGLDVRTR